MHLPLTAGPPPSPSYSTWSACTWPSKSAGHNSTIYSHSLLVWMVCRSRGALYFASPLSVSVKLGDFTPKTNFEQSPQKRTLNQPKNLIFTIWIQTKKVSKCPEFFFNLSWISYQFFFLGFAKPFLPFLKLCKPF